MDLSLEGAHPPKKSPMMTVVGVIALLFVVLAALYFQNALEQKHAVTQQSAKENISTSTPQGILFFSVITKSTTTQKMSGVVSGVFDTARDRAYDLHIDRVDHSPALAQQFNFSSDSQWVTFIAAPVATSSGTSTVFVQNNWAVYRAKVHSTLDRDVFMNLLSSSTELTTFSDDDYIQGFPSIETDGTTAYDSLPKNAFESLQGNYKDASASRWSIFLVRPFGTKTRIANGLHPKWIDLNRVAYLKDDGVYLFDLNKNSETLVLRSTAPLTAADGFDVSNDGKSFAVSEPSIGVVEYGSFPSVDGVQASVHTISVTASNPVFSPDGNFLALLTRRQSTSSNNSSELRVEYYDLRQGGFTKNKSLLDQATIEGIYLTDWR